MEPDMKEYPTWECRRCIEKNGKIFNNFWFSYDNIQRTSNLKV